MNSRIILSHNIKMDRNYNNVLNYSESQMIQLCLNNKIAEANNYSFIRTGQGIMTNFSYDTALQSNYIAFQNPNYSNKWFFAWIDEVIYRGDKNTIITFTIDAWSTWFSNWTPHKCFINRQHVNDDTIGLHTIEENLSVGEVKMENEIVDLSYTRATFGYYVGMLTNWLIKDGSTGRETDIKDKGTQYEGITVYNNNIFGQQLVLFKISNTSQLFNLSAYIIRTSSDGYPNEIKDIFIIPSAFINENTLILHEAQSDTIDFEFYTLPFNTNPVTFDVTISKLHNFSDYTPKNNKLFTYPYNYLYVTNNTGSSNIYKYEDFTSENCVFANYGSISIGGSAKIIPKNYKNMVLNDDEGITLGKYPTCAWSSDAFSTWLTQNSINLPTNYILGGLGGVMGNVGKDTQGAMTFNTGNAIVSSASLIANTIDSFYQAELLPNIQGGQASGDVLWSMDRNTFVYKQMRAKTEYLKIIDDYFTRFGYKIVELTNPNITGRPYWNYIEIADGEEIGYGSVPSQFMEIINNACRRGVTIWHNHNNIGNYDLDNSPT